MTESLAVEIVLATPERQVLLTVNVREGATVADVIAASGLESRFPGMGVADMPVGIWGKRVSPDTTVSAGDRVELYRPLEVDPREARRQRARAGKD
ncbi:MAG TPA: RnfH family protein [Woeseiaceae bacterium]|nr:RnfH family protein [Woeseiaceae bacterium]